MKIYIIISACENCYKIFQKREKGHTTLREEFSKKKYLNEDLNLVHTYRIAISETGQ